MSIYIYLSSEINKCVFVLSKNPGFKAQYIVHDNLLALNGES